jgi:hypothetical protein
MTDEVPWRGDAHAPERPRAIPLPGARMPLVRGGRPLKRWRWVGVFDERLLLCAAFARVGGVAQSWWAVWDREAGALRERTVSWRPGRVVGFARGRVSVRDGDVAIELELDEGGGVETVCPHGAQYVWTRKQGGVRARGAVRLGHERIAVDARAIVDDTAGYHARETAWRWCAGVGVAADGRAAAWNLVEGVNDPPVRSERTLWVDGEPPREAGPVVVAAKLDRVDGAGGTALRFTREAARERRERLGPVRSDYVQPFGTFAGTLPGGLELCEGLGVMEDHRAWW